MEQYTYLAHHGIKGQRWGVRRYQNEDGTLTEAGRKKYSKKARKAELKGKIHEGRAAGHERAGSVLKYLGGASAGTTAYFIASLAGASVPVAGAALGASYVGGKMAYSAMYNAAKKHELKLANRKYEEAKKYRELLGD